MILSFVTHTIDHSRIIQ